MKHLDGKDIQHIGKEILLYIKDICDNNNIQFFLAYGTVIGAIRHKGFIPWDDDIDIYMHRHDYEKFKQIVINKPSRYKLLDIEVDPKYYMPQVKMMDTKTIMDWHSVTKKYQMGLGVWVDIYVLDSVPDDDKELRRFQKKLDFLQRCYSWSIYKPNITSVKSFLSFLVFSWTRIVGPRFFSKKMVTMSKRYNHLDTRRIAPSSFTAASREEAVLKRTILGKGVFAEFEGTNYLVPEQTDAYLKHFYGNYMELPPEEKRVSNHTADFYFIEE